MEGINWLELLPVIVPSAIAVILAVLSLVLKWRNKNMKGMNRELSELILKIIDASKDRRFTQQEILGIIREAEDVIREAKKLLGEA